MKKFALVLCVFLLCAGTAWGGGMEISGSKVNLRSAPTTKSTVITQMNLGDAVTALEELEQTDGTWYRVRTAGGEEGWAFGKYVRERSGPLGDAEYREMMKDPDFAEADGRLGRLWGRAKGALAGEAFERLREEQRAWVAKGRDEEAKGWMEAGLSRLEAYTAATNERADALERHLSGGQ